MRKEVGVDIFESARGERRRFMGAAVLVLMVGILAPPAVQAAAKAITVKKVKQAVKVVDTSGDEVESEAIPPLGTTQAPGSGGALAVRTYAGGGGLLGLLLAWVLAPIAAAIIQMAVSRSREYQADESGAILSRDPDALASALRKLENAAGKVPVPASVSPAEAHLFIVNPFRGRQASMSLANLFSTHPPTAERVARLEQIKQEIA